MVPKVVAIATALAQLSLFLSVGAQTVPCNATLYPNDTCIPQEAQINCGCSGLAYPPYCRTEVPPPGEEECNIDADCGPYVQIRRGSTGNALVDIEIGHPPEHDDSGLTETELEAYKQMEVELYAEFLKNDPLYGEAKVDLPYCGLGSYERIGDPAQKRSIAGDILKGGKHADEGIGNAIFGKRPQKPYCVPKTLHIPVHFNIYTTNCSSQGNITDQVINDMLGEMKQAYDPMYIYFELGKITRYFDPGPDNRRFTQNVLKSPTKANPNPDNSFNEQFIMRRANRHGGLDNLHIFLVEEIVDDPPDSSGSTNGFCYYPGGSVDGCVIKFDTLPGVMYQNLNTASTKTIVHEAGHWLGLKHPFDTPPPTGACKGTDEVDDTDEYTYAERFSSTPTSCKTGKPFNQDNWMSYAVPRSRFTQGQRARAFAQFYFWRKNVKGPLVCTDVPVKYKRELPTWGRIQKLRELPSMVKRGLLGQRPNLLNELKAICQTPYSPDEDIASVIPDANNDINVIVDTESGNRPVVQVPGGGSNPGGTNPGGSNPGGSNPGGSNPGGSNPGGSNPGGNNPGGSNPGGSNPGGNNPGGSNPGGSNPGGNNPGGSPPGGNNPGDQDKGREIRHTTDKGTKCLDVRYDWRYNGSPVQLYDCNGTPAQKWVINKANTAVRLAGTNYCLDAGSYPGNFVEMKIWTCYDIPAQHWYFTDDNRIAVTDHGLCLDLKDGHFGNSAVVQIYRCTDYNTNQVWTV